MTAPHSLMLPQIIVNPGFAAPLHLRGQRLYTLQTPGYSTSKGCARILVSVRCKNTLILYINTEHDASPRLRHTPKNHVVVIPQEHIRRNFTEAYTQQSFLSLSRIRTNQLWTRGWRRGILGWPVVCSGERGVPGCLTSPMLPFTKDDRFIISFGVRGLSMRWKALWSIQRCPERHGERDVSSPYVAAQRRRYPRGHSIG